MKDDIDHMIREAEDFTAEDEVARKHIEVLNMKQEMGIRVR